MKGIRGHRFRSDRDVHGWCSLSRASLACECLSVCGASVCACAILQAAGLEHSVSEARLVVQIGYHTRCKLSFGAVVIRDALHCLRASARVQLLCLAIIANDRILDRSDTAYRRGMPLSTHRIPLCFIHPCLSRILLFTSTSSETHLPNKPQNSLASLSSISGSILLLPISFRLSLPLHCTTLTTFSLSSRHSASDMSISTLHVAMWCKWRACMIYPL